MFCPSMNIHFFFEQFTERTYIIVRTKRFRKDLSGNPKTKRTKRKMPIDLTTVETATSLMCRYNYQRNFVHTMPKSVLKIKFTNIINPLFATTCILVGLFVMDPFSIAYLLFNLSDWTAVDVFVSIRVE